MFGKKKNKKAKEVKVTEVKAEVKKNTNTDNSIMSF